MKTCQIALIASSVFSEASAYKLLRGHHSGEDGAQTRIIGGDEVDTGKYPYAVSLSSPDWGHFCGGSLIGLDVVLSAA
jgi:secreted trypsin-like serine protease